MSDVVRLNYSVPEAAEALGISERLCWKWIEKNQIPSIKIAGRRLVRVRDIEAWNDAQHDERTESARRAS